jgi:hypothetical protein
MIKYINDNENDIILGRAIQMLPFLKISGKIHRKRSPKKKNIEYNNIDDIEGIENFVKNQEDIASLLPSFLNYVTTEGNNLRSMLVLLKLLLTTLEEMPDFGCMNTIPITLNSLNNLNNTKLFGKNDVSKILKLENEMTRLKSFSCDPRILLIDGHPGKLCSLEVQGKTIGIIGGINVKVNSGKKYFEVTIKGENLFYQDIRVGWKKTNESDEDYINKYLPGDTSNAWVFDAFSGHLYHDAISIMESRNIEVINDPIVNNSELEDEGNVDSIKVVIYCPNGHPLQSCLRNRGWGCDARNESKGCRGQHVKVEKKKRFRCDQCDFDYCGNCFDYKVIEKILFHERAKIILDKKKDKLNVTELETPKSDVTTLTTPPLVEPTKEKKISSPDTNIIDTPPSLLCDDDDNDNITTSSIFQTPKNSPKESSSVASISAPSPKTVPIQIFRKMLHKGLNSNSVRSAMIEEGIPEDEIVDLLIAEKKIDSSTENLDKCIEKIFNQSIKKGFDRGGLLLNSNSSISKNNIKNKWITGTVIGCLLDTDQSEMSFFVDGVKYNTEIIDPNIKNSLIQSGLCPIFSCSSGAALEFNLGQASFKFEQQSLESAPITSSIWSNSMSPYLTLPYNIDAELKRDSLEIVKESVEPFIKDNNKSNAFLSVCHFPSHLLNGISIEISCRIRFGDIIEENDTYLSLVTCYIIDLENNKKFCQISVLRNGSISFELEGCEKIITPNSLIKESNWNHIAVTYSPIDAKNAVDKPYNCVISFFIDGKLAHSQNIASTSNILHSSQQSHIDKVNIGLLLSSPNEESVKSISKSLDNIDICEVRIWRLACSTSSILGNLGRSNISGVENNLLACLSFVEGCGSTIHNSVILNISETGNKKYVSNICCLSKWGGFEISDAATILSSIETVEEKQKKTKTMETLENGISIIDNESNTNIDLLLSCINNNLIQSSVKFNEISMNNVNKSIISFRKFQVSFGNLKSISDPKYINFVLINSLLRQLIRMEISNKAKNFINFEDLESKIGLLDLCITLLRVLAINFKDATQLGKLPSALGLQYSSSSDNICNNFVVKLLVTICYFVSISDSLLQEASQDELNTRYKICRQVAIDVIISGLDYFIPQSSDRLVLLECLLLKKYKSIHNTSFTDGKYSNSKANEILNREKYLYLSDFPPVEPIIALISLPIEAEKDLLESLCSHFSKLYNSSFLIPNECKPLSNANSSSTDYLRDSEWIAVSGSKVFPLVGDLVKRGPDWCYNDQDGGISSKGLITSITSWSADENHPNTCVNVLWIDSGLTNSYRWGLAPFVGDVLTSFYDLEIYRSKGFQNIIENNESEFVRRELNYTPEEVSLSLMEKVGGISKRTIFSYMKEVAPSSWIESNNLARSINTLQSSISSDSAVKLYSVFYGLFSLPKGPPATIITGSDDNISDHLKNVMYLLVDDVRHNVSIEVVTQNDSDNITSSVSLNLLNSLQGLLTNVTDNFTNNNKLASKEVVCPLISSRITKTPFMSSQSVQTAWNWETGSWSTVTNEEVKDEINKNIKEDSDFIFENKNSLNNNHFIKGLIFDTEVSKELIISNNLCKVTQTSHKQWSTIIGSYAMHPNTGVYRWYTQIDCLGKRGHCMFGIATEEFSCEKFLGQDDESFGLTTNRDLFQSGGKIKTDFQGKFNVGSILECIFDTDSGTLSYSDPMSTYILPMVAFSDLEEITYYPAWSLYSKGDSLSILRHSNLSDSCTRKEKSILSMKGVPPSIVIDLCINLILSATSMLKESHLAILHPLISTHLVQLLSTISRWQRISTYQDKILNSSLNTLLQVLWDAFRNARDSFHWLSPDSNNEDKDEKNIEKNKKILENHKLSMELILQLSCISCFYLGLLSSSWINGTQFNQINNQIIACEIMTEFQLQGQSLTSTVASKQFIDSINQPKEEIVKKDWLKSKLFSFGIKNSKEEHPLLIKDFINFSPTGPASCLLKWIMRHDRTHPNLQKLGGEYLNQAVQLLFAANIYHSGFLRLTTTLASTLYEYSTSSVIGSLDILEKIMSIKPPKVILLAWELAMELRNKSKKEAQNDEITFELIGCRCTNRTLFLFDLEQSRPEQIVSTVGVNDFVQWIVSFTNEFAHQQIIRQVSTDISLFSSMDNSSFFGLKAQLKTVERRATLREEGLKATRNNLGQVPDDSGCGAKCIILCHLPSALTSQVSSIPQFYNENLSVADIRHYHYGLEGSSNSKKIEIKGSFESLFSHLTDELTRSSTIGDISLQLSLLSCLGLRILEDDHDMLSRVSIFHVLQDLLDNVNDPSVFESSGQTLTTSGFGDPSSQITAFGQPSTSSDGLPQVAGFGEPTTTVGTSLSTLENPTLRTSPFRNVTQAAMKVFILLALQVANSVERESVMSINFVRTRSGPATLSSAVFDILFERISSVMTVMIDSLQVEYKLKSDNDNIGCKVVSTEIPEDSYVVLNEASILLLCIVKDSYCKKLLNTSRWIQLLLDMSLLCPLECQQRCLLILTDLFAVVNIKELEKAGPDMISNLSWYFRLFKKEDESSSIQEVIVKIMSSMCSKSLVINEVELIVHKQGRSKESFDYSLNSIPLASDAISLIRSLLNLSDWSEVVEDVLLTPFETALIMKSPANLDISTMREILSTLSIFGGHCDYPYPQSVAIMCDLVSGRDSEIGVITSISDDNVEFLTVKSNLDKKTNNSSISNMDKNLDISTISIDRLKPINRFPCQYLKFSERIISILLNIIYHVSLSTSSTTKSSSDLNTVAEDNGNLEEKELIEEKTDDKDTEINVDNSNTFEILRLTSIRCLTSLSVNTLSADIIQNLILDSNNHRFNYEFLVNLMEHSVRDSNSCGLADLNVLDDYLTLTLLQSRRILLKKKVEVVKKTDLKQSDKTKDNDNANFENSIDSLFQNTVPKVELSPLVDREAMNMESNEISLSPSSNNLDLSLFQSSIENPVSSPLNVFSISNAIQDEIREYLNDEDNNEDNEDGEEDNDEDNDDDDDDEDEFPPHVRENMHDNLDNSLIEMLESMGFPRKKCKMALELCGGDFDAALNYILSNGDSLGQSSQLSKNSNNISSDSPFGSSNSLQQEQSNEIIEKKSQTEEFGSVLLPSETIAESPFDRSPFQLESDACSDNSLSIDNPKEFYFNNIGSKFLPIYSFPNSNSDRLGSINPGDDILAFGEASDSNGKTWLKIRIEEYLDEYNFSSEDIYAWVPRYLGNNLVVIQGASENIPSRLENMSPDSIAIQATYKIIGVNGCIVRKGVETSTSEVTILTSDDLVIAVEECFNSFGKLRLRITSPVCGWISKLMGLVVKVSDDKINEKNPTRSQTELSELEMLEQVDDDMEQYGGSEIYRKENRLFGTLQGLQYQRCRDKTKSNNLYNRRSRIMGTGTRVSAKQELCGKSLSSLDSIIDSQLKNIIILYCRKSMLSILYRNECPDLLKFNQLAIGDSFIPMLLSNVIMNSKNDATVKSDSADNINFSALFTKFLSLCSFRGDPYSVVGIEYISMDEISFLTVNAGSLSTDIILRPMIIKLVKQIFIPTHEESTILNSSNIIKFESFQQEFRMILLSEVTKNIRLACQSKFSELSWSDCKYDEDTDEASKHRGNIHFSLWISRILISTDINDLILSVFNVWCLSLKTASLSLKQISVTILSEILDLLKNKTILSSQQSINNTYNLEFIELLHQCKLLIPVDRLYMMSSKRLWFEMEDNPAYSRFLQAVIHLLSEIEEIERIFPTASMQKSISSRSIDLIEELSLEKINNDEIASRSVIRFDTSKSHIQLSPQKDLQGSWTVEFYLCLDEQSNMIIKPKEKLEDSKSNLEIPVEIPKRLCSKNHKLGKGSNFYGSLSNKFSCDTCEKGYYDTNQRWYCDICKFDLCFECLPNDVIDKNKHRSSLTPLFLLSSPGGYIKVRSGGRLFNESMTTKPTDSKSEINDPEQETDFVCERSFCLSFGQHSGSEHIFDSIIPTGTWVHIALAYNHSHTGNMTLYIDGDMKDRISAKFHLPVATIGNSRLCGSSFTGDFAEMRVWSSARTSLEIKRDMQTNVTGAKGLVAHIQCQEGYGLRTFDSAGLLNNCKLSGCSWAKVVGPATKITNIPYFILSESSEEQEGLFGEDIGSSAGVVEMTGTLTKEAIPGSLGDSTSNSEVVCLCYRIKNGIDSIVDSDTQLLEGFIDWCERGVRSQMTGCLTKDGVVTLDISKDSTVLGAPESMEWLQGLSFQGTLSNGKIKGNLSYSTNVSCPASLREGECRLDQYEIPKGVTVKNDFSSSFPTKTILTVDEGKEGQYFITIEVNENSGKRKTSNRLSETNKENKADVVSTEIPYGIRPNEGSIWVQWLVNACPSGSIGIGISAYNAMESDDSCVFANPDAWCCTTDSTASVGIDLSEIEQIEVGDIIGVHLDTDSGELYIYRNQECLHYFSEVNLHPNMLGVDIPLSQLGVRPFACLSSAGDSISYLGVKKGNVKIKYLEEDALNRDTFIGSVSYGNFNGHCQISYQGVSGYWYGEWVAGKRHGLHLRVENAGNEETVASIHTLFDNDVEIQKYEMDEETYESLTKDEGIEEGKEELKLEEEKINCNSENLLIKYKEIYDLYKINKKITVAKNESALNGSSLLSPFGSGAENDVLNGLKRFTSGDFEGSRGSSPRNNEFSPNVTFRLRDQSGGPDMHFKVSVNVRLQKVIDVYASKRDVPVKSFWFQYDGVRISGDNTPEILKLRDDDIIDVVLAPALPKSNKEYLAKLLLESTAPYILQIIYVNGATVRTGIEIDESSSVRILQFGEYLESFQKTRNKEGIIRYRIIDGWISGRLRAVNEDLVVKIIRYLPTKPIDYIVVRDDGAKLRSEIALDSTDLGFVPKNTIISIVEKRSDVVNGEEVTRLRIESPSQWKGWISDKPHICKLTDGADTDEDITDHEILSEIARRISVRQRRATLKKDLNSCKESSKEPRRLLSLTGSLEVSSDTLFLINNSQKKNGITVSPDFCTVTSGSHGGRSMAFGSRGFTRGLHYWEVQVNAANWGGVFIGVSPVDSSSWSGYGLLNYRATQAFGSETLYGSYFSAGDKIGVLLDMDHGTISFIKDGEDFNVGKHVVMNMGVAYHNLRRSNRSSNSVLYPCFGVKSSGDELSIRKCKWVSRKGLGSSSLLNHILKSKGLMSQWRRTYLSSLQFSTPLLQELYQSYIRWRAHDKHMVQSRAGIEVAIDTTMDSMKKVVGSLVQNHKIQAGMRFRCSQYGEGVIVGTRGESQLWYIYDEIINGAWYWTPSELTELLDSGIVFLLTDTVNDNTIISVETTTDNIISTSDIDVNITENLERTSSLNIPSEINVSSTNTSSSITHSPRALLSYKLFVRCLKDGSWNIDDDEQIVALVNHISNKLDIDPLRISSTILEEFRSNSSILSIKSSVDIEARYAALCVLNKAASVALAYVDFGNGDSRCPLVRTSMNSDLNIDIADGLSPSGQVVKDIKKVLFTRTKLGLWNLALIETTTTTGAPPDEYERPDDLREININRVECRNTEKNKKISLTERFRLSVFGQLMDGMKSWDDRSLRRGFIHMQDAGQPRSFFVKFTGEGVDDHGGPYRAVFQTAIAEESTGPLGLLVKSPNCESDTGTNKEKLILNPELISSPARLPFYTYLGKLIGMACRHSILVPLSLPALIWKPLSGEILDISDLQAVDSSLLKSLHDIAECTMSLDDVADNLEQALIQGSGNEDGGSFIDSFAASMSAILSSYKDSELNDKNIQISLSNTINRLCRLIQLLRITSHSQGLTHLFKGLSAVLPTELFPLFTSHELEELFCGQCEIDLEVLKKATIYEGVFATDA